MHEIRNPVAEAVGKIGLKETVLLLRVSYTAVQKWRAAGRMPTDTKEARDRALLLARESGVPLLELLGFYVVQGGQPKRMKDHPQEADLSSRCANASQRVDEPPAPVSLKLVGGTAA